MKIMLEGRPGKVVQRGSTMITVMEINSPPKLPPELPDASEVMVQYVVYIPEKQWRRVEPALADPFDVLLVQGDCYFDAELKMLSVFALSVMTELTQRPKTA